MASGTGLDDPGIVWSSTKDSARQGKISLLACLETLLAAAFYWTAAIFFETTIPLLVSICIAPLLLLRSEQSVALGLKWFQEYVDSGMMSLWSSGATPLKSIRFWCSVLLAVAINGLASLLFFKYFVDPIVATGSITLIAAVSLLSGYLALVFALIFVAAFCNRELIIVALRKDGAVVVTIALLLFSTLSGFIAGAGLIAISALVAIQFIAATIAILYVPAIIEKSKSLADRDGLGEANQITIIRVVLGDVSWLFSFLRYGMYLGGWLRSLTIRFLATVRHPLLGLKALPENWKRTLFVQDIKMLPEVVPGYNREDVLNPEYIWRNRRATLDSTHRLIFFAAIIAAPYFYRLSIKSTIWASWSLAYINSDPYLSKYPQFLSETLRRSPLERFRRKVALASVVIFLVPIAASILSNSAADILNSVAVSPLGLLFIADLSDITPVQVVNLVSAGITLLIWAWLKDFEIKIDHATMYDEVDRGMRTHARLIEIGLRTRNVTSILFYSLFLIYSVLWLHPSWLRHFPNLIIWIMQIIYGQKMPLITAP